MTRQEFVDRYRSRVNGICLDLMFCGLTGEPLARRQRSLWRETDLLLAEMFDALERKPEGANGKPVDRSNLPSAGAK